MNFFHTAFGLKIRSNISVPGLTDEEDSGAPPDLLMHLGASPYADRGIVYDAETIVYESSCADDSGNPGLRIFTTADGLYRHLVYYDGVQFWLGRKGREIWTQWPETLTLKDMTSYLLGPVLGLLLRLSGITCLHASAVALGDECVAFVGAEGAGKSTTAATFAREGYGILSDDVVALEEKESEFLVLPAYPQLYLWPDSVTALFGSADAVPPFSSAWPKRSLTLGSGKSRFENRPLPLRAIYLLGERRTEAAPLVEAVPQPLAFLSLIADSFATKILDREMRAKEFEALARVVSTIPCRRIFPHAEASRVGDLCHVICEDFASLKTSSAAFPS